MLQKCLSAWSQRNGGRIHAVWPSLAIKERDIAWKTLLDQNGYHIEDYVDGDLQWTSDDFINGCKRTTNFWNGCT